MKPTDDVYQEWLATRRRDFSGTDLSLLVMASVRAAGASPAWTPPASSLFVSRFASCFGVPTTLVGVARLILFVLLVLTPA